MIITAPSLPIKALQWSFTRADSLFTSGWTGAGIPVAAPFSGRWKAHLDLAVIQGETNVRSIKSFIARCQGTIARFQLPATAGAQNANSGVTLAADASAGDTAVTLSGYTAALKDGQLLTVKGQLLCCTADQSGATVTFLPPLRAAVSAGAAVETSRPYTLVRMTASSLGWKVDPQRLFGISFDVEEAVREADGGITFDMTTVHFDSTAHLFDEAA